MSLFGIVLVLFSALMHATWNLFSKDSGNPSRFLRKALQYSTVLYLPVFVVLCFYTSFSPAYLVCVIASGLTAGIYFVCLGKGYQGGHVSVVYPIARSFPILIVAWVAMLWGQTPSAIGLAGIILVVVGCFILPLKRFCIGPDGLAIRNYMNWSSLFALGAAVTTSIYSLIDKYAAVSIPAEPIANSIMSRLNYVYLQNAFSWIVMEALYRLSRSAEPVGRVGKRNAIMAGLLFLFSYGLIMLALAGDPVAYVVTCRQISIVLAAVVSMTFIEKQISRPRLIGVIMIFAGVVMVGLT